ncbi:MAG: hypothetical protein WAV50_01795 [Minisyncoccia bacterium]
MTLEKGVTDDQLGRFHRRFRAIEDRLGKSLPYGETMDALQHLHDGTLRLGRNTAEDLQQLLERPVGAKNVLRFLRDTAVPEFDRKFSADCFQNKKRYPYKADYGSVRDCVSVPDIVQGQCAGIVRVFKMSGMANHMMLAAELLKVSDETPASWLQQLLIKRGYTLTLPSIEGVIDLQMQGIDVGLTHPPRGPCSYPSNLAFVEVQPGIVEMIYFKRKKPRQWTVSRYPFRDSGQTQVDDTRLIVRI